MHHGDRIVDQVGRLRSADWAGEDIRKGSTVDTL
jgi:hypothetical protein